MLVDKRRRGYHRREERSVWRQERERDARRILLRAVDSLRGFLKVGLLGFENIGNKFLRVAVDDREPSALDLHHNAVSLLENVVRGVQINGEKRDCIRRDGFGFFERVAKAAAEHFV